MLTAACAAAAQPTDIDKCADVELAKALRMASCNTLIGDRKQADDVRADAYGNRGSIHDEEGRHDAAIADFTQALKLVPHDPVVLIARGNAHDSHGDKQKAIADYTEAIRINPGDAAPYFNRAAVYQELGEVTKAEVDYKKALEIDPDFDSAKMGLTELNSK